MAIKVKLGKTDYGFYHSSVEKEFTEIVQGKMPHNVLSILASAPDFQSGMHPLQLNTLLLKKQPELSVDQYGYSKTLESLLKDFRDGELITYSRGYSKIKITSIGRLFLKENTVVQEG